MDTSTGQVDHGFTFLRSPVLPFAPAQEHADASVLQSTFVQVWLSVVVNPRFLLIPNLNQAAPAPQPVTKLATPPAPRQYVDLLI